MEQRLTCSGPVQRPTWSLRAWHHLPPRHVVGAGSPFLLLALAIGVGLPYGCSQLAYKERQLLFNIEPGTASWYAGLPSGVTELQIPVEKALSSTQYLHAWWWPAPRADAPAVLYLHGTRWNLTAQVRRISQLRELDFRCWPSTTAASARAPAICRPSARCTRTPRLPGSAWCSCSPTPSDASSMVIRWGRDRGGSGGAPGRGR